MKKAIYSLLLLVSLTGTLMAQESVTIDGSAQATAFPHFWEQMFGSGRAILSLRQSYRDDLRAVKTDYRFQIRPLSRHPSRRGGSVQRR